MPDPAYAAFSALDPFFDVVRQGLAGLVDGDHYFDTLGGFDGDLLVEAIAARLAGVVECEHDDVSHEPEWRIESEFSLDRRVCASGGAMDH